jgi:hypothetical protein
VSNRIETEWYMTGESRIVPSWFGFLRAEIIWRKDFKDPETGEVMEYQLRPRSAGPLPGAFDGPGAFGFWSTMASRSGLRAVFRNLIRFYKAPEGWQKDEENGGQ